MAADNVPSGTGSALAPDIHPVASHWELILLSPLHPGHTSSGGDVAAGDVPSGAESALAPDIHPVASHWELSLLSPIRPGHTGSGGEAAAGDVPSGAGSALAPDIHLVAALSVPHGDGFVGEHRRGASGHAAHSTRISATPAVAT